MRKIREGGNYASKYGTTECLETLRETSGFTNHGSWFSVLQNWATFASEAGEQGIVPDRCRSKRTIIKTQSHLLLASRIRLSGTIPQLPLYTFTIFLTSSTSRQDYFLDEFAKLRQATIGFVMCIRPPAWNNSAPNGRIFIKFYMWVFFEYLSRKFKFLLKSDKRVLYKKTKIHFWSYFPQFLLEREISRWNL